MLRTIKIGEYLSVQGVFVRDLADGRIAVRVGQKTFAGLPIPSVKRTAA